MRLISSDKAVSEVVGTIIILAITIIGISMITLVGVPYIFKIQDMANVRNVEQTFTIIDSQASKAFFGDNPVQIIDMNINAGTLEVQMNGTGKESYIEITRTNITSDKIILPMGKLKYRLDERIVAYEGGGIWSKYPSGGSVMLSPPEFHYDGRTLTLPIIYMDGNASIGGKGTASISFTKKATTQVYPNGSIGNSRVNPLDFNTSGKVFMNITSEYHDAWAEYARTLLYTKVSTNASQQMAIIELTIVPKTFGGSTEIANPINFRGLPTDDQPLENFSFKIKSGSNQLKWDIRVKLGNNILIFYLKDDNNWIPGRQVTLSVGYQESDTGRAEMWNGASLYTIMPDNFIYVDLLNKSLNLTYQSEPAVGSTGACSPSKISSGFQNPSFSWASNFNNGATKSIYDVTQHYISKLAQVGDISFTKCNAGPHEPGPSSSMIIDYNATGAITFLHVTNNTVGVSIK